MRARFLPLLTLLLVTMSLTAFPPSSATAGDASTLVTGGDPVSASGYAARWPFLVGLLDPARSNDHAAQFCGGSLISPRLVVTAAHCVVGDEGDILPSARLEIFHGSPRLSTRTRTRRHAVSAIIPHPGYALLSSGVPRNDIAIVRLANPITSVTPARIVGAGENALWGNGAGRAGARLAGWGLIETGVYPNVLREATVPIKSDAACRFEMGFDYVPTQMLCAGNPDFQRPSQGVSACFGDSGGPLVVPASGGSVRLAGISSFVGYADGDNSCGRFLAGFARLATYRSWIASIRDLRGGPGGILAPTNFTQRGATATSVFLDWDAPSSGPTPARYGVYQRVFVRGRGMLERRIATVGRTAYSIHGLTPSNVRGAPRGYSYVVRSLDRPGNMSPPTEYVTARTRADDVAPRGIGRIDVGDRTRTTIELTWSGARDNDRIDRYVITRLTPSGPRFVKTLPVSARSFTVTGLQRGTRHSFRVRAYDRAGNFVSSPRLDTSTTG